MKIYILSKLTDAAAVLFEVRNFWEHLGLANSIDFGNNIYDCDGRAASEDSKKRFDILEDVRELTK